MKRAWILGIAAIAIAIGGVSCSLLSFTPWGVANAVQTRASKEEGCNALLNAKVSLPEESALGGAMALNWVARGGGLMIDVPADAPTGATAKPAEQRAWWDAHSTLAPGPRNDLSAFVNSVGKNLAAQSERPTLEWSFGVLNSDGINAISSPGGYVFVTRGLLARVENEAQLAGVLAHEISHITKRHALKEFGQIKVNTCKTWANAAFAGQITGVTASLDSVISTMTLGTFNFNDVSNVGLVRDITNNAVKTIAEGGFGPGDEFEADIGAVELMVNAGYDPHEYIKLIQNLPGAATHHPSNADRVKRMNDWLSSQAPQTSGGFVLAGYPFTPAQGYAVLPLHSELAAANFK